MRGYAFLLYLHAATDKGVEDSNVEELPLYLDFA